MNTLKIQPNISFDSTTIFWDSTLITLDNNSSSGVYFVVIPTKPMGSTVTARFFNELTRETTTFTLNVESNPKGTYKVFIPYDDFTEKATYEFWLNNGSTEVYKGKLYVYLGATQNYSVYANE
jgi:hypothetical protein